MVPNVGLEIKSACYLGAQRLRKAILAAIYVSGIYRVIPYEVAFL